MLLDILVLPSEERWKQSGSTLMKSPLQPLAKLP